MTSSDGANLNAIFWGTMMLGRAIGIPLANYLTPTLYATLDVSICVIAASVLAIEVPNSKASVYACTAVFGLAMATVYGNGVTFVAKRMNVSGSYMWVRLRIVLLSTSRSISNWRENLSERTQA